jgi:uncharacterized membrane protein HdeD (DUF308 family)
LARSELPFTRKNWILFGVGLLVIAAGYILLRVPPVDGFLSLTAAPILLVVGYCVLVPAAILVREGENGDTDTGQPET